jgi:hypothetical protein
VLDLSLSGFDPGCAKTRSDVVIRDLGGIWRIGAVKSPESASASADGVVGAIDTG